MTVLNTSASNFSTTEATSPRSEDKRTRDHSEQKGDFTQRGRGSRKWKEPILTAVNQPVVVLLERLGAVTAPREVHCGNALGTTLTIIVQGHVLERANRSGEKLLRGVSGGVWLTWPRV